MMSEMHIDLKSPNLAYFKSKRAKIVCAETVLALLGGILNATHRCKGDVFLGFMFWTTFIISGAFMFLNVFGAWEKLVEKYAYQVFNVTVHDTEKWFNVLYVGSRIFFYIICAIISFFPLYWSIAYIVGYIELLLFFVEGYILYKMKNAKSGDIHTLTDYQITEYDM